MPKESAAQNIIHQRRLTAAGYARYTGETAERERNVDFFEVVLGCAYNCEPAIMMVD